MKLKLVMKINIKKTKENAIMPSFGSADAAGADLYAASTHYIKPHTTEKISVGWAIEIPKGYFGAIFARSGLASKKGLRPANCVGIVDSDYRGDIIVALHNDTTRMQVIDSGDRIAQLIILPFPQIEFNQVEELSDTDRGSSGFGSTGN